MFKIMLCFASEPQCTGGFFEYFDEEKYAATQFSGTSVFMVINETVFFVHKLFSVSESDYFCGYREDQKTSWILSRAAQWSRHCHVPVNWRMVAGVGHLRGVLPQNRKKRPRLAHRAPGQVVLPPDGKVRHKTPPRRRCAQCIRPPGNSR